MKTKPGYIRFIGEKIKFEYYELEKPNVDNFRKHFAWTYAECDESMRKYEASKKLIEVSNVNKRKNEWYYDNIGIKCPNTDWTVSKAKVINNQPCKAEVTDKAKIIELISRI